MRWLLMINSVLIFGNTKTDGGNNDIERKASLVVLPPLVIGYDELYDDADKAKTIPIARDNPEKESIHSFSGNLSQLIADQVVQFIAGNKSIRDKFTAKIDKASKKSPDCGDCGKENQKPAEHCNNCGNEPRQQIQKQTNQNPVPIWNKSNMHNQQQAYTQTPIHNPPMLPPIHNPPMLPHINNPPMLPHINNPPMLPPIHNPPILPPIHHPKDYVDDTMKPPGQPNPKINEGLLSQLYQDYFNEADILNYTHNLETELARFKETPLQRFGRQDELSINDYETIAKNIEMMERKSNPAAAPQPLV